LLGQDNSDWDAKYNLERALRLAPEAEEEIEAMAAPPGAERAITTMRGFTLGLP
jgi:mxaK protein